MTDFKRWVLSAEQVLAGVLREQRRQGSFVGIDAARGGGFLVIEHLSTDADGYRVSSSRSLPVTFAQIKGYLESRGETIPVDVDVSVLENVIIIDANPNRVS